MFANIAAQYMGISGPEDIAARFREHVFQAGVIEDLDAFRKGLTAKTGNDFPAIHTHRTSDITETSVSRETRRLLEQLFALDFEIYEYARKSATQ